MERIGIIGMGNMGYAILKGLLKVYSHENLIFTDASEARMNQVTNETRVLHTGSNAECANQARYLILAVKPQYYDSVIKNIVNVVTAEHIIISIAPGITISQLKGKLGIDKRIVRAMPNTPALIGEGMTGVCYDETQFSADEKDILHALFQSFGKMRLIEERLMGAVICASGSSPAFVYLFIEALADSAVKYGLPRDVAYEMAAQAVAGSARMVLETGEHPGVLKDKVCSPGGTTIAGISALEEYGFRNSILKAADACYEKSETIRP